MAEEYVGANAPRGLNRSQYNNWIKGELTKHGVDPKKFDYDQGWSLYAQDPKKAAVVGSSGPDVINRVVGDIGRGADRLARAAMNLPHLGSQFDAQRMGVWSTSTSPTATPDPPPMTVAQRQDAYDKALHTSSPGQTNGINNDTLNGVKQLAGNDPNFAAILQANPQLLTGGTSANLWSGLPVDPTVSVYGFIQRPYQRTRPMGLDDPGVRYTDVELGKQPASYWLSALYKMNPDEMKSLQQQMFAKGWYSGTNVTDPSQLDGRVGPSTLNAYAQVLGETARYNDAGKNATIDDVIKIGMPDELKKKQGQAYSLTSPVTTKAALETSAQQLLGGGPGTLSPDEAARFSTDYQAQERAAQLKIINDNIANRTEGVVTPPSPADAAQEYILSNHQNQAIAYGMASRMLEFQKMLGSVTGL